MFIRLPWFMTILPLSWNIPIHSSLCRQSYLSKTQGSAVFYLWQLAFTHSIKPQILSLVFKGFILCLLPVFRLPFYVPHTYCIFQPDRVHWPLPENALYFLISRLMLKVFSLLGMYFILLSACRRLASLQNQAPRSFFHPYPSCPAHMNYCLPDYNSQDFLGFKQQKSQLELA